MPHGDRARKGVGDGVKEHVSIGVAGEALRVVDGQTAAP